MAFPDGWTRKCPLVIQSSQVAGTAKTHVQFPVLLTTDNLPSEMFDADGSNPAQADGGDIRFSADAAGTQPLPCEIVLWATDNNPANGVAEIWVSADIGSDSNTTIYVWYQGPGGSVQPDPLVAGGAADVWDSSYYGVYHWSDNVEAGDSTRQVAGANDMTQFGGVSSPTGNQWALADGKIGKCMELTGSANTSNHHMRFAYSNFFSGWPEFVFEGWIRPTDILDFGTLIGFDFSNGIRIQSAELQFRVDGTFSPNGVPLSVNTWTHFAMTFQYDAGTGNATVECFVDGVSSQTVDVGTITNRFGSVSIPFGLGTITNDNTARAIPGKIDEFRVHGGSVRDADFWLTNYRAQNSPGTFVVDGAPETVVAGAQLTIDGLVPGSEIRAYVGSDPATATEIADTDSSGASFTFSHSEAGNAGFVVVRSTGHKFLKISLTYSATDTTIPVQQVEDPWYSNP